MRGTDQIDDDDRLDDVPDDDGTDWAGPILDQHEHARGPCGGDCGADREDPRGSARATHADADLTEADRIRAMSR